MTLTIDIKDNVADKILYFLDHFQNDIKVIKKENTFLSDMKKSQNDLENGNLVEIENIDNYMKELSNEIK